VFGVLALCVLAATIHFKLCNSGSFFTESLAVARAVHLTFFVTCVLLQPTVAGTLIVAVYSKDVASTSVAVLFCVIYVGVLALMWKNIIHGHFYVSYHPEPGMPFGPPVDANSQEMAALVVPLKPDEEGDAIDEDPLLVGPPAATKKEAPRDKLEDPFKPKPGPRTPCEYASAGWQWLRSPFGSWHGKLPELAPEIEHSCMTNVLARVFNFAVLFDPLYGDYRAPHQSFAFIELIISGLLAIVFVIATVASCNVGAPLLLVLAIAYFASVLYSRPHNTRLDFYFASLFSGIVVVAAIGQFILTFVAKCTGECKNRKTAMDAVMMAMVVIAYARVIYEVYKLFLRVERLSVEAASARAEFERDRRNQQAARDFITDGQAVRTRPMAPDGEEELDLDAVLGDDSAERWADRDFLGTAAPLDGATELYTFTVTRMTEDEPWGITINPKSGRIAAFDVGGDVGPLGGPCKRAGIPIGGVIRSLGNGSCGRTVDVEPTQDALDEAIAIAIGAGLTLELTIEMPQGFGFDADGGMRGGAAANAQRGQRRGAKGAPGRVGHFDVGDDAGFGQRGLEEEGRGRRRARSMFRDPKTGQWVDNGYIDGATDTYVGFQRQDDDVVDDLADLFNRDDHVGGLSSLLPAGADEVAEGLDPGKSGPPSVQQRLEAILGKASRGVYKADDEGESATTIPDAPAAVDESAWEDKLSLL